MLGILYLILSSFVGYNFLKGFIPRLFKVSKELSLFGKKIKLSNWMVTLPAGFLTGTLFTTWITYLLTYGIAVLFPSIERPLIYGDLITFLVLVLLAVLISIKRKEDFKLFFGRFKKINVPAFNDFVLSHKTELIYVFVCLSIWSVLMIRSFYVNDRNEMIMGASVFSDFGGHVPMIRSFSEGSNFPTEYPHYGASAGDSVTGNNIRYHFMFQFLSGNLEFLGLRIDWAFNLPSILSMLAFLMLLYSFVVLIFGNRLTGILASILFFFRSSFAVFTYTAGLDLESSAGEGIMKYPLMIRQFLLSISTNITNIGKTTHEEWGFYAQKVFVNKRHYIFALGVAILVLIIVFPLFKGMISRLRKSYARAADEIKKRNNTAEIVEYGDNEEKKVDVNNMEEQTISSLKRRMWFEEFLKSKDSWVPDDMKRSIIAGLLLGLTGFWNGAVVISMLPILFFMAIFSKNRLEYLNIAGMTILLVFAQTLFFTGGEISTGSINLTIGYLAEFPNGINATAKSFLEQGSYGEFIKLIPDLSYNILLFYLQLLGFMLILLVTSIPFSKKGGRWLILAFLSPMVMATLFSFSSDVGANHVIVIFSVILLNIIIANMLSRLFVSNSISAPLIIIGLAEIVFYVSSVLFKFEKLFVPANILALIITVVVFSLVTIILRKIDLGRVVSISVAAILMLALTSSGIIDGFVLFNMDKSVGRSYSVKDPVMSWVEKSSKPKDIFLINPDFIHVVLLGGRKVFNGGAYLVSTTGYDWDGRMGIVKQIYGATDANILKELAVENKIDYIVVDNSNRESKDYNLNEELIRSTFTCAFSDPSSNTQIYKVE